MRPPLGLVGSGVVVRAVEATGVEMEAAEKAAVTVGAARAVAMAVARVEAATEEVARVAVLEAVREEVGMEVERAAVKAVGATGVGWVAVMEGAVMAVAVMAREYTCGDSTIQSICTCPLRRCCPNHDHNNSTPVPC